MLQKLPATYIAGFVDGEGCFALKYRADRRYKNGEMIYEYHYWTAEFAIVLHPSDAHLLTLIQDALGVGRISFNKAGTQVRYSVQSTQELVNTIVPFFDDNPLYGTKSIDYKLWREAIHLLAVHQSKERVGRTNPMDKETEKKLIVLKAKVDTHKRKE